MTKTWLTSYINLEFNGYNQLNVYKSNPGGGIEIYYDNSWNAEVWTEFTIVNKFLEILTLKLSNKKF